ncbi:MAG: hypothetical protein ABTD50_05980 [Polyangiaceae bacterium]
MPDNERTPEKPKTPATPAVELESVGEVAGVDDEAVAPRDAFAPDAIAARIDSIGSETEADRIARIEEKKLLARKQKARAAAGKTALELAASKRLARIGEVEVKRPTVSTDWAPAGGDSLAERVAKFVRWTRTHQTQVGWGVVAALVCLGGVLGWTYWRDQRDAAASSALARALACEHGHISNKDADDDDHPSAELYPTYASAGERRSAALSKYREVEAQFAGTGAAYIARLAEGGLLLDQGDPKGALAAFVDIKGSPLARADSQVQGRALEGIGFAHEALAEAAPAGAERDRETELAMAAFKELAQSSSDEQKALGAYHQARLLQAKGDTVKAIELLKGVHERVIQPSEGHAYAYLQFVVDDRLRDLDPTALPPEPRSAPGSRQGPPGLPPGVDPNDPNVQRILQQMREQQSKHGGPAGPGH